MSQPAPDSYAAQVTETAPQSASEDEFFSLARSWSDRTAILAVTGEIDSLTSPDLADAVRAALGDVSETVVLDLSAVSFFSSTGLSVLIEASATAHDAGKPLRIVVGDSGAVLRAVEITGLDRRLDIYDSVDDALAAIK